MSHSSVLHILAHEGFIFMGVIFSTNVSYVIVRRRDLNEQDPEISHLFARNSHLRTSEFITWKQFGLEIFRLKISEPKVPLNELEVVKFIFQYMSRQNIKHLSTPSKFLKTEPFDA